MKRCLLACCITNKWSLLFSVLFPKQATILLRKNWSNNTWESIRTSRNQSLPRGSRPRHILQCATMPGQVNAFLTVFQQCTWMIKSVTTSQIGLKRTKVDFCIFCWKIFVKIEDPLNDTLVSVLKSAKSNSLLLEVWSDYQTQEEAAESAKSGGAKKKVKKLFVYFHCHCSK